MSTGGRSKTVVLAAMVFAVAMTFIDQTIVSIAAPQIQRELGLTSTGMQWAINAYLLSLAALFALGGRLADTVGHRRMVVLGVIVFAVASVMCGLTPPGGVAEAWIVTFRVIQGAGGAIMFPAAIAIVVQTFSLRERGRALALFFGVAGGLTAVGPILGGYLTQWTWRAIFWVNVPIAVIALILIVIAKPVTVHTPARLDYRGAALIAGGVALSVFGFQQSAIWGWSDPATGLCIAAGLGILLIFGVVERRTSAPLIRLDIFRIRAFLVENMVLAIAMTVFLPVFFFASEYAQIALAKSASDAGLFILYFFIGFVVAAQIGGRILDRAGAKAAVVLGCALSAVGFWLWARMMNHTWDGIDARSRPDRCRQPSVPLRLRGGDRHHPDGPQLRGQPRAGDPRHDPGVTAALTLDHLVDRAAPPRAGRRRPRVDDRAVPGSGQCRGDPTLRPPGLRGRDPHGPHRHGGDHGRRRSRLPGRLETRRPGGDAGVSRRFAQPDQPPGRRHAHRFPSDPCHEIDPGGSLMRRTFSDDLSLGDPPTEAQARLRGATT
jgi:MFS family permease